MGSKDTQEQADRLVEDAQDLRGIASQQRKAEEAGEEVKKKQLEMERNKNK